MKKDNTNGHRLVGLRQELAVFSRRAYERGLISATGGNMSVRICGTETILITPSGVSLGDVEPETAVLCDFDRSVIDSPGGFKPSKEISFHLQVYKARSDVMAVAHLHPPHATAYSIQGNPLPLVTITSRVNLKMVPWIDTALPGSEQLARLVTEGIKQYPGIKALLMKEHGILAMGPDLKTAYYVADLVEDTARVAFLSLDIARGRIKIWDSSVHELGNESR